MKILVMSDSHGCSENLLRAIKFEVPDYMIHLGDYSRDVTEIRTAYPFLPIINVKGNCDLGDFITPDYREAVYNTVRVMAVHGHTYGVKSGLLRLFMAAKEKAVHVALFGHTHRAYCEQKDGIWLMNPGSCGAHKPSYGIIEIIDREPMCCVKYIDMEDTL